MELMQCTVPLPRGSEQWNSCNALSQRLGSGQWNSCTAHCPTAQGAVGSGTHAMHCPNCPGAVGSGTHAMHCPNCPGAVGTGTHAMHCPTARGQWAVELLQCTVPTPGQWAVELMQCTVPLPGGSGQCNSCNALSQRLGAVGSGTPAMHCPTAWGQWAVELLHDALSHCPGAVGQCIA